MQFRNRLHLGLSRLEDVLHVAGCLALAAVALLINADVVLRMLFDEPVEIQFELTEIYLMPALAALSLSRVYRDGGHLSLDVVPEAVWRIGGGAVRIAVLLLSAGFVAALAVKSGQFAARAFARDEIEFGVIDWPLGWAYASVPLGAGVLALRLALDALSPPRRAGETLPDPVPIEEDPAPGADARPGGGAKTGFGAPPDMRTPGRSVNEGA